MSHGLGYAHLAPLPLAVDSEAINALLNLICERGIEKVLHLYSPLGGSVFQIVRLGALLPFYRMLSRMDPTTPPTTPPATDCAGCRCCVGIYSKISCASRPIGRVCNQIF